MGGERLSVADARPVVPPSAGGSRRSRQTSHERLSAACSRDRKRALLPPPSQLGWAISVVRAGYISRLGVPVNKMAPPEQRSPGGSPFSDFFEMLFGGARQTGGFGGSTRTRSWPGASTAGPAEAEAELALPLEDMHRGTTRHLNVRFNGSQKTIEVRIPPGARDESRIRVPGGGPNGGDLYVRLKLETHPRFTVKGDDTEVEIPITPWEAALGATVQVPTLDGHADIRIPPGVDSGQRLRLKQQGLNMRGGGRGDHFIRLKIVTPKRLTEEQKRLFSELAAASDFNPRG